MALTKHGHYIEGSPAFEVPKKLVVEPCGGVGVCNECTIEARQMTTNDVLIEGGKTIVPGEPKGDF